MARNTYKQKPYYPNVGRIIARHYLSLWCKYCHGVAHVGNYCGRSREDIFADTVFYVLHDGEAEGLPSERLLSLFDYRYRMLLFRARKDAAMERGHDPEAADGVEG